MWNAVEYKAGVRIYACEPTDPVRSLNGERIKAGADGSSGCQAGESGTDYENIDMHDATTRHG
jgi:hypothetical protein